MSVNIVVHHVNKVCADTHLDIVRQELKTLEQLMPPWLERIELKYDSKDQEDLLYVETNCARRYVELYICDGFTQIDFDAKREALVHEIAHVILAPISELLVSLCDYLEKATESPPMVKVLRTLADELEEFTVVDLIRIMRQLEPAQFGIGFDSPRLADCA